MAQPKLSRRATKDTFEDTRINWDAFRYYPSLKRILVFWSEQPGQAISVSQAASLAAMTRAYFSRFFHDKTGVTFKHWIDFMRVKHAASLLGAADMTVIELAEGSGFHDSTTFTRTFKRITGRTPLQFKRMLQAV